MNGILKI